ncbi:unnamed protein product [Laminaria digitata]
MEGGTRARIKVFSDRPGVRALIKAMESGHSGEPWSISDRRSTRMVAISSIIQKGQPLHTER